MMRIRFRTSSPLDSLERLNPVTVHIESYVRRVISQPGTWKSRNSSASGVIDRIGELVESKAGASVVREGNPGFQVSFANMSNFDQICLNSVSFNPYMRLQSLKP